MSSTDIFNLLIGLTIGFTLGWFSRTHTVDDRYLTALAAKHESSALYFNTKLDNMIKENERSFARGK